MSTAPPKERSTVDVNESSTEVEAEVEAQENIEVAPDEEGWAPQGYVQPHEDDVVVEEEHAHASGSPEESE